MSEERVRWSERRLNEGGDRRLARVRRYAQVARYKCNWEGTTKEASC